MRLRDLREDLDKSQKEIAELLDCTQQTYSRYENQQVQMPYGLLFRLADYYGTSIDYLLGRTDERKPYPPSKRGKVGSSQRG